MLVMSKKRIVLTSLLSVGMWIGSNVYEIISNPLEGVSFISLGDKCYFTGYPIARCIPEYHLYWMFILWIVNIFILFFLINVVIYIFNLIRKA
jgi:hypothetical protein